MYEFEVYGIEPQGDTPALFGLDITPRNMQLKEGESVQLSVKGYDQFGNEMSINPTYLVTSGEGNVTANGLLTSVNMEVLQLVQHQKQNQVLLHIWLRNKSN